MWPYRDGHFAHWWHHRKWATTKETLYINCSAKSSPIFSSSLHQPVFWRTSKLTECSTCSSLSAFTSNSLTRPLVSIKLFTLVNSSCSRPDTGMPFSYKNFFSRSVVYADGKTSTAKLKSLPGFGGIHLYSPLAIILCLSGMGKALSVAKLCEDGLYSLRKKCLPVVILDESAEHHWYGDHWEFETFCSQLLLATNMIIKINSLLSTM